MKEKEFIKIITETLQSSFIGDDCALLEDLGITVTQDSLVEDVHFSLKFATPYQIGYKSVMVNISDICASGAVPKYLTIALSLPDNIDESFIKEFYRGAKAASGEAKIVGGDITGADKIYISVTAIGCTKERKISSRKNAKIGQKIVISGEHGSSGMGLSILCKNNYTEFSEEERKSFITAHLMPEAQIEFSKKISTSQTSDYAMMDTSDGLADALFAIAEAGNVMLDVDFERIPHKKCLEKINDYNKVILYGGEDYGLIATVDNADGLTVIGKVKSGQGVRINYKDFSEFLTKQDIENNTYNHFKE